MTLFATLRMRFLKTFVLMAIAFQAINISIDPIDHLTGAQDIAINEIESCVEFVLEVVMGKDDAVEETDEPDDSSNRHTNHVVFFNTIAYAIPVKTPCIISSDAYSDYYQSGFFSPVLPVTSPPPKQA